MFEALAGRLFSGIDYKSDALDCQAPICAISSERQVLSKAGELLKQLEKKTPQTANPSGLPTSNVGHGVSEYGRVLEDTRTTRQDAHRWQRIADIPAACVRGAVDVAA